MKRQSCDRIQSLIEKLWNFQIISNGQAAWHDFLPPVFLTESDSYFPMHILSCLLSKPKNASFRIKPSLQLY